MRRLLDGKAIRSDGSLTNDNLAIESSVSRATLYRASTLLVSWRKAVEAQNVRPDDSGNESTQRLAKQLEEALAKKAELEKKLAAAKTIIAALALDNENVRKHLSETTNGSVINLR